MTDSYIILLFCIIKKWILLVTMRCDIHNMYTRCMGGISNIRAINHFDCKIQYINCNEYNFIIHYYDDDYVFLLAIKCEYISFLIEWPPDSFFFLFLHFAFIPLYFNLNSCFFLCFACKSCITVKVSVTK